MAKEIFDSVASANDLNVATPEVDAYPGFVQALVESAGESLPPELQIGSTPASYLDFISRLHEKSPNAPLSRYRPAEDEESVVQALIDKEPDEPWLTCIVAASLAGLNLSWLPDRAARELQQRPNDNSLSVAALVASLVMRYGNDNNGHPTLEVVRNGGRIFALIASTNDGSLISDALILGVLVTKPDLEEYTAGPRAEGAKRYKETCGGIFSLAWPRLARRARDASLLKPLRFGHLARPHSAWGPLLEYLIRELQKTPEDYANRVGA